VVGEEGTVTSDEEKEKSISEIYEREIKQEGELKLVKIMEETIGISDQMGRVLSTAIQNSISTATQVLEFAGIRGKDREFAKKMIARGDQEAERTAILLLALQMKRQAKWRWITLGVALATL